MAVPGLGREGFPEEVVFELECEDQHLCREKRETDKEGTSLQVKREFFGAFKAQLGPGSSGDGGGKQRLNLVQQHQSRKCQAMGRG